MRFSIKTHLTILFIIFSFKFVCAQEKLEPKKSFSERMLYYQERKTWDFGPKIGITSSTLTEENNTLGEAGIRVSLMGGMFARYMLSERVLSEISINYVSKGGKFNKQILRIDAIEAPLVAGYNVRFKLIKIPMTFNLFGGVQPSINILSHMNGADVSNSINPYSIDFVFGSGFPMGRWMFYATNKIGITNTYNYDTNFLRSISTDWWIAYRF